MKDYMGISTSVLVFVLVGLTLHAAEYRTDEVIVKFKPSGLWPHSTCPSPGNGMVIAWDNALEAIRSSRASGEVEYAEPITS